MENSFATTEASIQLSTRRHETQTAETHSRMRLPAPPKLDNAVAAPLLALLLTAAAPPLLLSPSPALAAASASPTSTELSRLSAGLARVDYLLRDWDRLTTVCNGVQDATEAKQVARTIGDQKCSKSPLIVQRYIGASSTLDPLFKADKLMIRAASLVAPEQQEEYSSAVDVYIREQQMSSTMAYTSSWSGSENPNGSVCAGGGREEPVLGVVDAPRHPRRGAVRRWSRSRRTYSRRRRRCSRRRRPCALSCACSACRRRRPLQSEGPGVFSVYVALTNIPEGGRLHDYCCCQGFRC
jgi:hypothetical protein